VALIDPALRPQGEDVVAEVERHRGALPDGPVAEDAPLTLPVPLDPTHYAVLGLDEHADAVTIAQVVEHLALPPAASAAVAAPPDPRRLAAAVLGDPLRRAVYDAWLVRERRWLARVAPSRPADRLRRRLRLALRWLPVLIPVALLAVGLAWLWLER
jgi:hypothetical protein